MPERSEDYPWPPGRYVRALLEMTLEGALSGIDGRSGSISGPADREVLAAVRRYCDAVVVGAQTMRVERYNPMRTSPAIAKARTEQGLAAAPRLVILSGSLQLPWADPAYSESAMPPIIVTGAASDVDARKRVPQTCELLIAPTDRVEAGWLVDSLIERGLSRIVCEGGPGVLAEFLRAGVVDEWALTLSGTLPSGSFVPVSAHCEDEFVFTRFVTKGDS